MVAASCACPWAMAAKADRAVNRNSKAQHRQGPCKIDPSNIGLRQEFGNAMRLTIFPVPEEFALRIEVNVECRREVRCSHRTEYPMRLVVLRRHPGAAFLRY